MIRWLFFLPFAAVLVARGPEGDRLLAESVAAHGGLERFRAVRDWRIVADRRLAEEPAVGEVYEEYLLREPDGDKTLLVKKRSSSVLVFGHDGERGFALTDGRLREDPGAAGEAYYRAHGEYYLRSLPFKWMDPGMHLEPLGRERAGGRELDLLRITAGENVGRDWKDIWVAAIDARTHLLWEARLTHHRENETWLSPAASGTQEIVYRYSDYRDVRGLLVPHRLEYHAQGQKSGENVIREIQLDSGLSADLFRPESHLSHR
jgi:hypothetical protein